MIAAIFSFFLFLTSPKEELSIRVVTPTKEVEFGKAFPLTITRTWGRDWIPGVWNDPSVENLQLKLEKQSQRENGDQIEEIREFAAYAFGMNELVIPSIIFEAHRGEGSLEKEAKSEELRLTIRSTLPAEDTGVAEVPGDLLEQPFPWLFWSTIAAAILAVLGMFLWFRRRRAKPTELAKPVAPRIPPLQRALARLAKLRMREVRNEEEVQGFYVEASSLIREYLEESFGLRAPEMTTEEFLNAAQNSQLLRIEEQSLLREFLDHCDLVKFAKLPSKPTDREKLLTSIERFLKEAKPVSELVAQGNS